MKELLELRVNGVEYELGAASGESLLHLLRYGLGLLGTKENCLKGECGVCTILIDRQPVYACLVLATMARGRTIMTVEGLAEGGVAGELQEAFLRHGALQCGYCTPGMLISAHALLEGSLALDEQDVRQGLAGNLCRCTGYAPIIDAVLDVAAARRSREATDAGGSNA